ncbi:MAG: ABC transporter substrate-binding protein [Rubrivivax sp.]
MRASGISRWRALAACGVLALAALQAQAQALRIGMSAAVTSMDPHYYNATPNNTIAMHVFEPLVAQDGAGRLKPALATAWKAVGDTAWEFKLREGVRWHDGKPFTAADVAFALERLKNVPGAPGGFSGLVNTIASVQAVNPTTVLIRTTEPSPNIPVFMTFLAIVSAEHGRNAKTEDYNSGKAMVGTGPYRFVRQVAGESVELVRNDDWWGAPKPAFQRVVFRIVPTLAVRTTSLLAGDLDLIEAPAATDLARLRADPKVAVFSTRSSRVSYVNPIQQPAADAERVLVDGKPAERTPFADLRVRRALSMAINRQAIVERVMLGTAEATGQIMPAGLYSSVPDIGVPAYDPAQAKKLLAEAGYPNGFGLTLVAANDRVPYNVEVAQAIAQMWSRVGVETKVNGIPTSVYAGLASNQRIAAYVGSWGSTSMEVGTTLGVLLRSYDKAAAKGTYNWSRYSNPELDRLVDKASTVLDAAQREKMLQDATRVVVQDQALIPLFHFVNGWAARAGLVYEPRADGMTLAQDVRLAAR